MTSPAPVARLGQAAPNGYAFLQSRRLTAAKGGKRIAGPPPQPTLPAIRQAILDRLSRPPPLRCPHCNGALDDTLNSNLPK